MRAEDWDERYAERRQWSAEPNALVAELLADLPPGDAVDLRRGRAARAVARRPRLAVTACRLLRRRAGAGPAQPGAGGVRWVTADVRPGRRLDASLDLVLVAYLHLAAGEPPRVLTRAVGWLRPGGRLLVLGHDVENITAGVGGPQEPAILHTSTGSPRWRRCSTWTGWNRSAGRRRQAPRWTPCCGDADGLSGAAVAP